MILHFEFFCTYDVLPSLDTLNNNTTSFNAYLLRVSRHRKHCSLPLRQQRRAFSGPGDFV
ncbi:hypothetical protein K443DRAFT_216238 [Laccaria amethystina LaAM-08-1]|uniref:Uncharacterized protein n=1 Tax=Laccaria amethystina LaAM-08-1 TaxID=1095629 RepID=A0A0C9YGF2_9AGAR|nr:hypothetical protein K443DRAFT_216238 [Laccaria amethystina LaAM-08-1]